jgi:hypothetical protein
MAASIGAEMPALASFQPELRRMVEGDVRFDVATLAIYSTDASNYRQVPIGVVTPRLGRLRNYSVSRGMSRDGSDSLVRIGTLHAL